MPDARYTPIGLTIARCQELAAVLSRLFLKLMGGYTVQLQLPQQLNPARRYVIAANHQSLIDPFALFSVLDHHWRKQLLPLKFMTIPKVYHRWYVKPFAYLLGCFPAHNRERDYPVYGVGGAVTLMSQGYNLCIFPEGTRTLRSESNPKSGIVHILAAHPDAVLLLAHIEWRHKRFGRRFVSITIAPASENIDKTNPKMVMDAIYAL